MAKHVYLPYMEYGLSLKKIFVEVGAHCEGVFVPGELLSTLSLKKRAPEAEFPVGNPPGSWVTDSLTSRASFQASFLI